MKRLWTWMMVVAVVLAGIGGTALLAGESDDYRVIRNAVKAERAPGGEPRFLKIQIRGEKKGDDVDISLPFCLVEMVLNGTGDRREGKEAFSPCGRHDIDWRKALTDLRRSGATSLVDIRSEGESIRIWLE